MPFEEFVRDSPTSDGKFFVSATLQESKDYGVATPPNNAAVVIVTPPPPAQVKLSLTKEIVGRNPRNGSFEFDIDSIAPVAGAPTSPITLQTQAVEIGEGFTRTVYRSEKLADIPVVAGKTVTITETPVAGFTPDRAECKFQDGEERSFPLTAENRSFELMVEAGNNIDCTVFNRADPQFGTLSLIKQINEVNARGGTFTFELTGAATDTIERTAVAAPRGGFTSPASKLVPVPAGGTVTVTEAASPGFTPNLAICTVAGGETTTHKLSATDRDFDVTINAGEAVECIVVNDAGALPTPEPEPPTEPAAPTLTVETISNGGTSTFTFTGSGAATFDNLALRTTRKGVAVASDVMKATAGPAKISQAETRGFTFVSAGCRLGETALGTPNEENRSIALEMPATGDVVCTFVNRGQSARTATLIRNFLNRRAEQLTGDTGRSRLIERRQSAGRFASGGLKDAIGVSGEGSDRQGRLGVRTSLSKLGGALGDDPASVKASRLGVNASDYGVSDGVGYRSGWDIWTEANWNYRRSDGGRAGGPESSGQFGLIRGGVDYLVSPNMLVGVLVQYDYLSDESKARGRDGYDISGHGWMAGPYVEVAISKNLIFDGKALWGTSRNTVSPDLTFTDSFTTERWLASARLTGSWTWAQSATSSWHFAPQAEVVWFDEKSAGFTNTLGVDINSQHVRLGRFKAGPEISYRHRMANGTVIEPRVGAQALWRFTGAGNANAPDLDIASSDALASVPLEKFQMRFEGGLKIETAQGTRFEVQGAYTGLGRQGQETIGGKVGVTIPLQ